MPASDLQAFYFLTLQGASGKPKLVGSRGSMVAKLKLKGSGLVSCETRERELPAQFLGSPDPTMFFRSVISSGTCCPLFFFKKVRYKKRTAKKLKTTRLAS